MLSGKQTATGVVLLLLTVLCRGQETAEDLARKYPGMPCRLRLSQYDAPDSRLPALARGIDASGLFPGKLYRVRGAADVERVTLRPGDRLELVGTSWRDQPVVVRAHGTRERPVLVFAEAGLVLTGRSTLEVSGDNVIVYGLRFVGDGRLERSLTALRMGTERHPCDNCILYKVAIESYNSAPDRYDKVKVCYVGVHGTRDTVAECAFKDKENFGTLLQAGLPASGQQRLRLVHNLFSGFSVRHKHGNAGGYKFIQTGHSGAHARSAYSVFEDNTFERDLGESETIAVKVSDVVLRRNRFLGNAGHLSLHAVDRCLVEDNLFDGQGQEGMGGVRLMGADHWLVGNVFTRLVKPRTWYVWPVALQTGRAPTVREDVGGNVAVKDVMIAGNTFDSDTDPPVAVGIYPDPARQATILPTGVHILRNRILSPVHQEPVKRAAGEAVGPVFYLGGQSLYHGIEVQP